MKNLIYIFIIFNVFFVACSERQDVQSSATEPSIPNFSVSELTKLSKNERQELERRCLGSSHMTCLNLKSESFKNSIELDKSFCRANNTLNRMNKYSGEETKNCDL